MLAEVEKGGTATTAGLKLGDIIIKIDNDEINSKSEFEEELSYHYPAIRSMLPTSATERPLQSRLRSSTGMVVEILSSDRSTVMQPWV
ncbi:MAG: PDZ domain-containing protein [Bacteroidota bacterium]